VFHASGTTAGVSAARVAGTKSATASAKISEAAVEAVLESKESGTRTAVSVEPEGLGRVSITVDRGADGVAAIHVSAERLTTLEILRNDRAELSVALDGSGQSGDGYTLSFSWDGPSGNHQLPWEGFGMGDSSGHSSSSESVRAYSNDFPSSAGVRAAARGGVDVTA
jgi:hypothetical protein